MLCLVHSTLSYTRFAVIKRILSELARGYQVSTISAPRALMRGENKYGTDG